MAWWERGYPFLTGDRSFEDGVVTPFFAAIGPRLESGY
jgi:hypothetical protein